jgi:hypothetical protein
MLREVAQHLKCLGPQRDVFLARAQTSARQVEREAIESENALGDLVHFASVAGLITVRSENSTRNIILLSPLYQDLGGPTRLIHSRGCGHGLIGSRRGIFLDRTISSDGCDIRATP